MQSQEAHGYADAFKSSGQPPWLHGLYLHWRKLFEEPYHGITNDGRTPLHFCTTTLARQIVKSR
jgi:hypothetical protein